jgi:hypothetical protein
MNNLCKLAWVAGLAVSACSREPTHRVSDDKAAQQAIDWTVSAADETPDSVGFAASHIIYDLVQDASPSVRAIRDRCRDAKDSSNWCDDSGTSSEAIIGLLGAGGEGTTSGLLKMMAIQLDAALGEERECQIGKRGKRLLPALRSLDVDRAASWCHAEFAALRKRALSDITDVSVSKICRSAGEIEGDRREWIKAFEAGEEGCAY